MASVVEGGATGARVPLPELYGAHKAAFEELERQENALKGMIGELAGCGEQKTQQSLLSSINVLLERLSDRLAHVEAELLQASGRIGSVHGKEAGMSIGGVFGAAVGRMSLEEAEASGGEEEVAWQWAERHQDILEELRRQTRRANLMSQQEMEAKGRRRRMELLAGEQGAVEQRREKQQQSAVRAAIATTQALARTKARLEFELERSGMTLETLEESASVIKKTLDEHHTIGDTSGQASFFREQLKSKEVVDCLLILAATIVYIAVFCYVLHARLLWWAW